jgi:hypothetical protein
MKKYATLLNNIKLASVLGFVMATTISGNAVSGTFDDFNNSQWTILKSKNTQVVEVNKQLEITISSTAKANDFYAGYKSNCKLQGDFDIQASYSFINYPNPNGVRVGISLTDPKTSLGVNVHQLDGEYVADFCNYNACSPRLATTDTTGKLRFVRTGTVLSGFYWDANSSSWTQVNSTSSYTTNAVPFSISAWSGNYYFYKKTVKVAFDDVIINKGTCK